MLMCRKLTYTWLNIKRVFFSNSLFIETLITTGIPLASLLNIEHHYFQFIIFVVDFHSKCFRNILQSLLSEKSDI